MAIETSSEIFYRRLREEDEARFALASDPDTPGGHLTVLARSGLTARIAEAICRHPRTSQATLAHLTTKIFAGVVKADWLLDNAETPLASIITIARHCSSGERRRANKILRERAGKDS